MSLVEPPPQVVIGLKYNSLNGQVFLLIYDGLIAISLACNCFICSNIGAKIEFILGFYFASVKGSDRLCKVVELSMRH